MKIKLTVSIGLVGCKKTEIINWDDKEWAAMSEHEREDAMRESMFELIDWRYEELPQ